MDDFVGCVHLEGIVVRSCCQMRISIVGGQTVGCVRKKIEEREEVGEIYIPSGLEVCRLILRRC